MSSKTKFVLFKIAEISTLLTPMIVLFCNRWNIWFIQKSAVSVSLGAILGLVVALFLVKGYAKKIGGIIWATILFVMCYLLKSVINDAYLIFGSALLGQCLSYPFKILSSRNKEIARIVKEEYERTYAREQALEEMNKGR